MMLTFRAATSLRRALFSKDLVKKTLTSSWGRAFSSSSATVAKEDVVFEVDMSNFGTHVMQSPIPVILDCYADWCEPCKTLMPMLEKATLEANGKVRLAKLNVDLNQPIAQQLQIQSLPTVFGLHEQRMIDRIVGLPDAAKLSMFMDKMIRASGGTSAGQEEGDAAESDIDLASASPEEIFNAGFKAYRAENWTRAVDCFKAVIERETNESPEDRRKRRETERREERAIAAAAANQEQNKQGMAPMEKRATLEELVSRSMALTALAEMTQGNMDDAVTLVSHIRENRENDVALPDVSRAIGLVELSADCPPDADLDALQASLNDAPDDHERRMNLAKGLAAVGQFEVSIEHAMEVVKYDKDWNGGEAKAFLLRIFSVLGPQSEISKKGRRRLSNYIF